MMRAEGSHKPRGPWTGGIGVWADPEGLGRRARRIELAILLGAALLTFLHCLYFFNQACDDGYISLGYARRWVEGRGLTLNDVAPSEGYSNLLWVMLLAGGMKLGVDGLLAAKVLGLACALGVSVVGVRLVRVSGGGLWSQAAAGVFIGGATPLAAWSVTGLETPLYALEVISLAYLAGRLSRPWGGVGFALMAGAMAITRPEGGIVAAALILWLMLTGRRVGSVRRGLIGASVFLCLVILAHQVFRVNYFGRWLGHSTVHKWHPMGVAAFVRLGLKQLGELTWLYWWKAWPALWLLLAVPLLRRATRRRLAPVAVVLVAVVAFHLLVGGDIGPYFRFLVPAVAPAAVLLSRIGSFGAARSRAGMLFRATGPALAAVLGVSGMVSSLRWLPLPSNFYACPSLIRPTAHAEVAEWLRRHAASGDRVLLSEMGLIPYASDLACFDYLGLCDRFMYEGGGAFHAERFDDHRPRFVILGWVVLPGGQVSARLPAGNGVFSQPEFARRFRPVAEFPLVRDRSLMEYGYYRNRPPGCTLKFLVFEREAGEAASETGSGAGGPTTATGGSPDRGGGRGRAPGGTR
ncbi:MAG: hypothetical protein JXQ73_15685 [Phycisphaerae bacterium]|nr:hypothetical protein [Phycisphaerae bacterium]